MYTIERKAEAEESIDKLQCLGERIELYFKTEHSSNHENQLKVIKKCNDLLNKVLLQPRLPNAGEYIPNIKKTLMIGLPRPGLMVGANILKKLYNPKQMNNVISSKKEHYISLNNKYQNTPGNTINAN